MSALGIANPLGAVALGAVAVLVALHFLDRRRRVIHVSSLFLWRRLPAAPLERRRRFRPDLLFLLQLLVLLALIGGYVRPYVVAAGATASGRALLVVIDVSASMQAHETEGTRLALATRRASALVSDGVETMLVAAAERPHVLLRWTSDATLVRRRLETLEALDVPTNLAAALALALGEASARPGTRIAVFTDVPPDGSGLPTSDLAAVDYVQLGRTDDNVAIAALTVDAPPFRDVADATATVLVRNHSGIERRVALGARIGGTPWERRELALGPHASASARFVRPPASGVVTVALDPGDALAVDDVAVGWLPDATPLDVVVASDVPEVVAAFGELARVVPRSRIETVATGEWPAVASRVGARTAVLDRFVPPTALEPARALYLAPPSGNAICPADTLVEAAAVVDWEADHPAVRGLDGLEALVVARPRVLATPPWGTPVVLAASRAQAFPLLVAGERDGRRTACLGVEPTAPLAASDQLPLLLLVLSTLHWLDDASAAAPLVVRTGDPVGDPPVVIGHAGVQRIGTRQVLANLFDDRESDIGRDGGGEWPATATPAVATGPRGARELGWWLYVATVPLLGIEWLAWLRRRA
jgi:hypothetical protein